MRNIHYFSATWCKSCQTIKEEISLLKHNVDIGDKQEKIIFSIIDIDEDSSLADEMEVVSVPSIVFVDDNQKIYSYNGSNILEIMKYIDLFLHSSDTLIQEISNDINKEKDIPPIYPSFKGVSEDNLITVQLSDEMNNIFSDTIIYHIVTNNLLTQVSPNISITISSNIESNNHLDLFEYNIPVLSNDGTCSNADRISSYSFNLAKYIYNVNNNTTSIYSDNHINYLLKLKSIVNLIYDISKGSEWIGIYRLLEVEDNKTNPQFKIKDRVLVKESYRGTNDVILNTSLCLMLNMLYILYSIYNMYIDS